MIHKCKAKACDNLEYFRYDKIINGEVYIGMAYGFYGRCRVCKALVKSCTTVMASGQVREIVLVEGESKKTKTGNVEFTKEEARKIKEKYETETVS
jgi:hypothetical protein